MVPSIACQRWSAPPSYNTKEFLRLRERLVSCDRLAARAHYLLPDRGAKQLQRAVSPARRKQRSKDGDETGEGEHPRCCCKVKHGITRHAKTCGYASDRREDRSAIEQLRCTGRGEHPTSVAQARPRHHGEGHDADRTDCPGMHRGGCCNSVRAKDAQRKQGKTDGNECIADVQDGNERLAPGTFPCPSPQPQDVRRSCPTGKGGRHSSLRCGDPHSQRRASNRQSKLIEAVKRARQPAGSLPDQPVPRKAWNDPSTNEHDQQQYRGNADAQTMTGGQR